MPATAPTFSGVAGAGTGSIIPQAPFVNPNAAIQTPGAMGQQANQQQKTVEPTVLSSANIDTKNQDNVSKMASMPQSGQTVLGDGLVRNADGSFAEAPQDALQGEDGTFQSGGLKYALGYSGGQISSDPYIQSIYDQFTQLKQSMDATGAEQLQSIRDMFASSIAQQEKINTSQQAALQTSLIRSGSDRYTQDTSTNTMAAAASEGQRQIADLQAKETQALIAAKQAINSGDMQMLDKQLSIVDKARTDKQAAAQKIADNLQKFADAQNVAKIQAAKDNAIQSVMEQGITDPSQILAQLQKQGNTDITAKDIADTIANLNPNASAVNQLMADAAKFGAPKDVLAAIGKSKTVADAITAAGGYINDPTSAIGQYRQYVREAQAAGHTPEDYATWDRQQKASQAYATSYATESAKSSFVGSAQNQDKLEQQGRQVILKELSNRSGGLGIQDGKVNQAIHLRALLDQYKDKNGNYNVPPSQYAELAQGMATLLSNNNTLSDARVSDIQQRSASGDLGRLLTYVTGTNYNGSTQDILKNLADSIDRQGAVAEQERQTYLDSMANLLPTDLSADRRAALLQGEQLNSYTNPKPSTLVQNETTAKSTVQSYIQAHPDKSQEITSRIQGLEKAAGRPITTVEFLQAYPEYAQQ